MKTKPNIYLLFYFLPCLYPVHPVHPVQALDLVLELAFLYALPHQLPLALNFQSLLNNFGLPIAPAKNLH